MMRKWVVKSKPDETAKPINRCGIAKPINCWGSEFLIFNYSKLS